MSQKESPKIVDVAITVVACLMALYHLVSTQYLIWGVNEHDTVHLAFSLTLVFLTTWKTMKTRKLWPLVGSLLLVGLVVCGYFLVRAEYLREWVGFVPSTIDWVMGVLIVIVVIETTRQSWGWVLPIVAVIFIAYFFYGHLLPPPWGHVHFKPEFVISMLGLGWHGVFAFLSISANYIFLFVLFAGILAATGATRFFIQIGRVAGSLLPGGAAQTSVISSAAVGMVMGQAVTNVLVTGAFTIPLMKKTGYKPEQAGAIEAAASSGGQIMPPIMGESIFLMATFLGMAYIDIAVRSFLIAALYFLSVAFGVHLMAMKAGIPRLQERLDWHELALGAPVFIIPLVILIILLIQRLSPMYAAFYTILAAVIIPFLRKETRPSLRTLVAGFTEGAVNGAKIAVAISMVGILAQTLTTTGLGQMIAAVVEDLSGGHLYVALLITMFISLFLGMGVPTLAAYAIVAVIVAPVLVNMGVTPLAAHIFAFWFAVFSTLTPPVAFASMAGAALAGGDFMKTSWIAFKLAISGFIIPYLVISCPVLMMFHESFLESVTVIISAFIILGSIACLVYSYFLVPLSLSEKLLLLISVAGLILFCITKTYILFVVGFLLFVSITLWQWRRWRRRKALLTK